jgi:hypothetical protein
MKSPYWAGMFLGFGSGLLLGHELLQDVSSTPIIFVGAAACVVGSWMFARYEKSSLDKLN